MSIIKNCELWYVRLNTPDASLGRPRWSLQLRTNNPAQMQEWRDEHLNVRLLTYPAGHDREGEPMLDEGGARVWKVNLGRNTEKADGTANPKVEVVNGALQPINPDTVGHGSIGNVRIFQYEYVDRTKKEKKIASVLMGLQVTHHIVYEGLSDREEFEAVPFTTVSVDGDAEDPEAVTSARGGKKRSEDGFDTEVTQSVPATTTKANKPAPARAPAKPAGRPRVAQSAPQGEGDGGTHGEPASAPQGATARAVGGKSAPAAFRAPKLAAKPAAAETTGFELTDEDISDDLPWDEDDTLF